MMLDGTALAEFLSVLLSLRNKMVGAPGRSIHDV